MIQLKVFSFNKSLKMKSSRAYRKEVKCLLVLMLSTLLSLQKLYIAGFEQNVQELQFLLNQQKKKLPEPSNNFDDSQKTKYEFELKGFHTEEAEKLARHYNSCVCNGLTQQVAASRLLSDGPNSISPPKEWPMWSRVIGSFWSGFNPLLWISVVLILLFPREVPLYQHRKIVAALLLVFILLASLFSLANEVQTNKVVNRFHTLWEAVFIVIRGGRHLTVPSKQLVVGDIVVLDAGCKVPADLRVVQCAGLEADTSMFTGEVKPRVLTANPVSSCTSFLVAPNTIFVGSSVVQGTGRGLVIATGSRTQLAKITQDCHVRRQAVASSAIPEELKHLVRVLSLYSSVLIVGMVLYWVKYIRETATKYHTVSVMLTDVVTLMLAITPIALPLAVDMGFRLVGLRLSSQCKVVTKSLGSIVTLGAVTLLACDKTGTLTQNKTAVVAVYSATDLCSHLNPPDEPETKNESEPLHKASTEGIRIAILCNEARLQLTSTLSAQIGDLEIGQDSHSLQIAMGSNATDRALLQWACSQVTSPQTVLEEYEVRSLITFTSSVKIAAVAVRNRMTLDTLVLVKGAPEIVLPRCTTYQTDHCTASVMTDHIRSELSARIDDKAALGSRMLILAQRVPIFDVFSEAVSPLDALLSKLTFVAVVAMSDPLAEDVTESLQQLREAGILFAMITGDGAATAVAVARQVGIITSDANGAIDLHTIKTVHTKLNAAFESEMRSVLVLGGEVDAMTGVEWDYVLSHRELVFAQTTPENKLQIVKQCQQRGHIVGVTGDGGNDCSALSAAQVGIAMSRGSDVAKEVADIILLDDSFMGIVSGVREGRLMFDNLRKSSAFLLSVSCGAQLLPLVVTFFLGLPKPVPIFCVVLVACATDLYGAVALMCEEAEPDLMQRPPRRVPLEPLVNSRVVVYAFMYGTLVALGALFNYFALLVHHGYHPRSLLFTWWEWEAWAGGPKEFLDWKNAASVYLVSVVVGQMAHLVSIRRKSPYFYSQVVDMRTRGGFMTLFLTCCPLHWPVTYALLGSVVTLLVVLYTPYLNIYIRTAPIAVVFWGLAAAWAMLWFVLAEIRKWCIALLPDSWFVRYFAW